MGLIEEYRAIKAQILGSIAETLETDVADLVKSEISAQVQEKVYSYPTTSKRRGLNGGLADISNYTSKTDIGADSVTLTVENDAPFQHSEAAEGITLADVVEAGTDGFNQPFPRPFMEDAELAVTGAAEQAIIDRLHRKGL